MTATVLKATNPTQSTEMTTFPIFPEHLEGSFDVFYSPKGSEEFYQDVIHACLDVWDYFSRA